MTKKGIAALLGLIAFCTSDACAFAQCVVQVETVARQSADDLAIRVQGNCSHDCQQLTVHWTNPLLPDKTVFPNHNTNDTTVPNTWSVPYTGADGLTLSMLVNSFDCGSENFSLRASCANVATCEVNAPTDGLKVHCKEQNAICTIQDTDLRCGDDGRLRAETSVSSTGDEAVSVMLTVARDGQNIASQPLSDSDGFLTVIKDLDFVTGTYNLTTSITAPSSCVQTRSTLFPITQTCAGDSPPTGVDNPTPPPPPCTTCALCGGDWTCCLAWVLVFVALLIFVGTALYLVCDPSGGGGWGWLVLAIAALVFGLALWWVIAHCQFNLCTLLEMLAAAFTIDLTMVCAVEGLLPCFSSLICGVTVIFGQAVRNWFLILLLGLLVMFGIGAACPLVN